MECFNDLLLKLREVHERELEGWQVKVQELSNKKGCDTKRMEELFTRNQQMKEQHRLLTENIKILENRLRAGLCDRCTVTQEVANRRQQEFEASHIQSIQHISLMVGEMTNLKKENKRLRDEIRNFRAVLDDHSSNSSPITEAKPNSSPDFSPSTGPETFVNVAKSRASNQQSDGDAGLKTERDKRTEEAEHRQLSVMSRSHYESFKPLSTQSTSWKSEHGVTLAGERRAQGIEGLDQRSSIPSQALLHKNSSSSTGGVNLSRHVLHTPVPCRPQPIRSSPLTLPWPLSDSTDWVNVSAAGTSQVMHPSPKPNLPRFPNLVPTSQHANPRRQVFGCPWPKQGTPQSPAIEPTVVFRFRNLLDHPESQIKPQEKKEMQPTKAESVSGEGLKEICEGPLDLSDRGKSKTIQPQRDDWPLDLQGGEKVQMSPDNALRSNTPVHISLSSHLPVCLSSSSSSPLFKQQEEEPTSDHNHKVITDKEQKEAVNGNTDQSNEKKVPVLTISLRPVVVLETLNSALQKQESLSSNGKSQSSSPPVEPGSSSDEQDEEKSMSGQESRQGCKRKRASVDTETDRESDTDNIQQEKNRGEEP
ncbi:uncharacterized protein rbbp8l isoform X2 [Scophthalmus maximus]|uniref:uncharacterized protein rbbp8l isoform X2 n=1 Tax=Scophthalmus maximus TaxID=52904 RepID=UPI0015E097BA|nr:uncharacterized protein rbbp8l isoform X2 [Scophthalmus maximus]